MKTITRKAYANWLGDVEGGDGFVSTDTKTLNHHRYSLKTRVGEESEETNPEELLAAAAASCFSMALSKTLTDKKVWPKELVTTATISVEMQDSGLKISKMHLHIEGTSGDIDDGGFAAAVDETEKTCPVYQLFAPGLDEVTREVSFKGA
jgi:osmotically inducible protein OsmC